MGAKDYYQLLGLERTASEEDIRRAYYERVNRYAPQMNASSRDFDYHRRQVTRAFEVLSDRAARAAYDAQRPGP